MPVEGWLILALYILALVMLVADIYVATGRSKH
jgi:hypothetical protein